MKKYQKPTMIELSISANDALCSGCSTSGGEPIKGNDTIKALLLAFDGVDSNGDSFLSESEANALFSSDDSCQVHVDDIDIYCKFNGQNSIIWS